MSKRYKHNLSNYRLLTGSLGKLMPCGLQEILPGDSIRCSSSALIRLSPQLAPVMHPITVRLHHWFVPHRLSWKFGDPDGSFEDFITGGPDGTDDQVVPTLNNAPVDRQLWDYLGVPPGDPNKGYNALPAWAFALIFNEWYRDQDLVNPRTPVGTSVPHCAWEKDYFTTSRPTPQKGPDITIPLTSDAPIYADGAGVGVKENYYTDSEGLMYTQQDGPQMFADLDNATATNVNDWRRAFALQRYQEARSRYGSRYSEYLKYLGVNSPDSRLQRPEYLGGGKQVVSFSEVLQTADDSASEGTVNVGTLRGHGIAALKTRPFVRHFNEHGYMLSLISLRPKTIYQDGVPRTFLRKTKEDFWQMELQQIGQQAVYNDEVYQQGATEDGDGVFGYQDRYAEYKRTPSQVTGQYRQALDFWHLARKFESPPALNSQFVTCTPSDRIFADNTNDQLWMMINHSVRARRLVRKAANNRIL